MRIKKQKKRSPGINVMVSPKAHKVMSHGVSVSKETGTLRGYVNILNNLPEQE